MTKAQHVARMIRSFGPALSGGLLGGAISFGILLISTIAYFELLYRFQTIVSGILAIVAALIVLFGVRMQIQHERRAEENKLTRDAVAFATALLGETNTLQSELNTIYTSCASFAEKGHYRVATKSLSDRMQDVVVPPLFEAPWRDLGLLSPDITLLVRTSILSIETMKLWAAYNTRFDEQPAIPGLLSPQGLGSMLNLAEHKEAEERNQKLLGIAIEEQIDYYEGLVKPGLQQLALYLETEADEYAEQLGLDEKKKWLRAQAKTRRDAIRQRERARR